MAFEDLLDHKCDIYHMISDNKSLGYGINANAFKYPDSTELVEIPCHFNVETDGSITQTEDANEYTYTGKLQLPIGTDIRINDKVVNKDNGLTYYAEIPKNIRGHHIVVTIQRKGKIKGAL